MLRREEAHGDGERVCVLQCLSASRSKGGEEGAESIVRSCADSAEARPLHTHERAILRSDGGGQRGKRLVSCSHVYIVLTSSMPCRSSTSSRSPVDCQRNTPLSLAHRNRAGAVLTRHFTSEGRVCAMYPNPCQREWCRCSRPLLCCRHVLHREDCTLLAAGWRVSAFVQCVDSARALLAGPF